MEIELHANGVIYVGILQRVRRKLAAKPGYAPETRVLVEIRALIMPERPEVLNSVDLAKPVMGHVTVIVQSRKVCTRGTDEQVIPDSDRRW